MPARGDPNGPYAEALDDLIFVAEHIRRIVESQVPDLAARVGRIHTAPNGVDLAYWGAVGGPPEPHTLLFPAALNWEPNRHAALDLVSRQPRLEHMATRPQRETATSTSRSAGLIAATSASGTTVWASSITTAASLSSGPPARRSWPRRGSASAGARASRASRPVAVHRPRRPVRR